MSISAVPTSAAPTSAASASAVSTSTPSTPMPVHEIEIVVEDLRNGYYRFPDMKVTETVRYFSKDGEVTIHLTGHSPFRYDDQFGTQVPGGVILTLVKSSEDLPGGVFHCGCSVTLHSGEVVGWPELKSAGADQHVGRP
jgi:hypothetical protein